MSHAVSRMLSRREIEVIELAARGLTTPQIGEALGLSPRTVQKHVINLIEKTGAKNKTHMVAMALAQGVVGPPPIERPVLVPVEKIAA